MTFVVYFFIIGEVENYITKGREKMRIGIFTDTYFPQVSGVATSIRVLKQQLEKNGHTVIIFTTTDPEATLPQWDIIRLGSIPLMSFKERRIAIQGLGKAYKIAKDFQLDIIHTQTEFSLGIMGKLLGRMLRIPTVHTYHTMYEKYLHYIAKGKVLRPSHVAYISKTFCNQTNGVIAPSQLTKKTLENYGVLQEISVIPTGVEIPLYEKEKALDLRESLGYTETDIVLLSLCRLSKEKNIQAILSALPKLMVQYSNIKLCIVGDGPERRALEKQVEKLGLEEVVRFVGEVVHTQVYLYYQMADLYVNASESETQGLTYLEAIVNRIPVIAKKNDYLKEMITQPGIGQLFQTDQDLVQTILEFLHMQEQISSDETEKVRNALFEQISVETFANKVSKLYETAIETYEWKKDHKGQLIPDFKFLKLLEKPTSKHRIGFIGIGVMGKSIVKHLLAKGFEVGVYTRTKEKAQEVLDLGAIWLETPREVSCFSTVIFTMVGYPHDVHQVYFGEEGLFSGASKGQIFVDLTTSTPTLAKEIYEKSLELECSSLDAPVSGGDLGAQNGTLSVMVGGEESVLEEVKPMLECFSKTVRYQGKAGAGQHTKMANQIMIAGTMTGLVECMVYANKSGLNVSKVLETVGAGSASNWSLSNYGPRILKEDYSPGFFAKHFLKDLSIAIEEAEKLELTLPATELAKSLYQRLCDKGFENNGTQALIQLYDWL